MMTVQRLTTPSVMPVPLIDAKDHCRINTDHEDVSVAAMIQGATAELEQLAEIAIMPQTIRVIWDGLGNDGWMRLPIGPVMAEPMFELTADGLPIDGEILSGLRPRFRPLADADAFRHAWVVLDYQAGFSAVPADIALAILDQVCLVYDQRGISAHDTRAGSQHGLEVMSYTMQRVVGRYRGVSL